MIHRPLIERYRGTGGAACFRFISADDLARERAVDYDIYIGSHRKELDARLNYDTLELPASITLLKLVAHTQLVAMENIRLRAEDIFWYIVSAHQSDGGRELRIRRKSNYKLIQKNPLNMKFDNVKEFYNS